ncbi:hypothetical protein ACQEVF_57445 [Nonomuraea polychroma]|uniref:hypothetical protein n=1 Tax=Nonomuraea polychroma TaxID=46176 RepID=UPI003D91CC5C
MSVSFSVYLPSDGRLWPADPVDAPNFLASNAARLGDVLGLIEFCHDGRMDSGGQCPVAVFRERLARFPDGHPDPDVHQRLAQLMRLVGGDVPEDALVSWG